MTQRVSIPDHPAYSVTDDGRVFSLRRNGALREKARIQCANGYEAVSLWSNNIGTRMYVHHAVLTAFVGERPAGCEALHYDGNRKNNALPNLRWGTRAENVADAKRHGTATTGARNAQAKLTRADIGWLKDMQAMGFSPREASRHFAVSATTIQRVFSGETYREEQHHAI